VYFDDPCKCENNHAADRLEAKNEWVAVPTTQAMFKRITPSGMFAWRPLSGVGKHSARKYPQEQQWYMVTGRVAEVRVQDDGDVHFELADATGRKRGRILAELPLGKTWCDLRMIVFSWTAKGTHFKRFQAGGVLPLRINPVVTVTGKAFFDVDHAGKNPLRNRNITHRAGNLAAWEIHPVNAITGDRSLFPSEVLGNNR
jgi:hypothetical protein